MSLPFFISKKYTQSKKQSKFISLISVIAISGIALGVAVLIITLTVLDAFEKAVEEKIINFNSHITITAFGDRNLPDYEIVIPKLDSLASPFAKSISPFVSKNVIVKSKNKSDGILLKGISKEIDNSKIDEYLTSGIFSFKDEKGNNGVIIGKKLSERLFAEVGAKLTVFSLRNDELPSYENPPSIEQFVVTGIYESGMAQYDDIAYIDLKTAQDFFDMNGQTSGYNIQVTDISKIDSLSEHLQNNLRYPFFVRTVYKMHQNIFTWLDLQKEPVPIILGLIIIVAVFNIIGMLLMIVLEKTSDIGILKSLGANRKLITNIFVLQGLYLSFFGIVIGNLLALIISALQKYFNIISLPGQIYFISSVPINFDLYNYLLVSVVAFVLSIAAAFIPSLIAARTKPISAIRID
ncbi:MAG: hypothetical protein A2068_11520 [Ignavibacteria bacterium GWB2_35_6b]|nr:MAG: hypothetical protein A2068_11520 [Ignavibacteria bacterium GWB2_35_6b]